jgi:hypothetical protein
MTPLSLIGDWRAEGDSTADFPDPHDWVDTEWDEDERHATWFYFATGTLLRTFMGYSPCRFCGMNNGAVEYTDGTYVWPEGLAHYIYDHAVRLPEELVRHARERLDTLEGREVARDWWVGATVKE